MPLAFKVNVSTNTQLQAGNQEVIASALSDYFNHQSGPLSGVSTGPAVGKMVSDPLAAMNKRSC